MYPQAFHYHRATSLTEAATIVSQLGEGAKLLAGGQSLIPLMKLRFASPQHLVDLNFISGTSYIKEANGELRFGPMTRHAEIAASALAGRISGVHDCAIGIADVQVRNRGTIGGSLAEADPSGDWATLLMTLSCEVHCLGPRGPRKVPLAGFIKDAYTTDLAHDEVICEIAVKFPPKGSGGAYVAFKRAAPVYPTSSAAVQLTLEGEICRDVAIVLGCVGLTPIRAKEAEGALRGQRMSDKAIAAAAEAARAVAEPQRDMRGSAEYKRELAGALVKRAVKAAAQRARGEMLELSHIYA